MNQFADGVKVKPLSIKELFYTAREIRNTLNLKNVKYFPVIPFLEILQQTNLYDFDFEILEDFELGENTFAQFEPYSCLLSIKNSIYEKAVKGDGFARFVITHEICHFWLHREQGLALTRRSIEPHKKFEDSEWQANTLASQLLVPLHMINNEMDVAEIASTFGVSISAADVAKEKTFKYNYIRHSA